MRALLSISALALVAAGCGPSVPAVIERTVGGEVRSGPFVAPRSYEHFVRGELARAGGRHREAIEHYQIARAGAADDPLLISRIAEAYEALGDHGAADRALAEGERLDPSAEAVLMARGRIAEAREDLPAAIAAYGRAAEVSDSEEAVISLSRVLRERGAVERADAVLVEWLATGRGAVSVLRARLALALARSDLRSAGQAALELARHSAAHGRELEESIQALVAEGHAGLAHHIAALMPEGSLPIALRVEVALAAGDRGAVEAVLSSWAPSDDAELVIAARAALAIGDLGRAAELAEVAARRGRLDGQVMLAEVRLHQGQLASAARLAAGVPRGSSAGADAARVLSLTLERAGLEALAREVCASAECAP